MLRNQVGNMDPIADMLTRIRNAQMVSKEEVLVPFSNLKFSIAKMMEREGFLDKVEKVGRQRKNIKMALKYDDKGPHIRGLKRVSKQGQRIYKRVGEMRPVRGGYGLGIVSTSQGLMTTEEARKNNVGGELICEIW